MRAIVLASAAIVAMTLGACATAGPPQKLTPVVATEQDQRQFAGVWRGHVQSADERLTGSVEFRFERGGVLIVPPASAPSKILWVRVSGNSITGALEPYFDPSKRADVYATFDATLTDGVLHGVLRERVHMEWDEAATWSAERVAN